MQRYYCIIFFISFFCCAISPSISVLEELAIQSTGEIIGVGWQRQDTTNTDRLFAFRLNSDGTTDTTFATSGSYISATAGTRAHGMVLDGSERAVIVGQSGTSYRIIRLTTAGALDGTFGTGGVVTGSFPSSAGNALYDVTIDRSGSVVAAGSTVIGGISRPLIVRYSSAGVLDATFGGTGQVATDVTLGGISVHTVARGVRIQSGGQIVIAGWSQQAGFLARYTSAGVLDGTYGTGDIGGIVQTVVAGQNLQYRDLQLDSSDQAVVSGVINDRAGDQGRLVRYSTAGIINGGPVRLTNGINSQFNKLVLQPAPGNEIVVAGNADSSFQLARYTSAFALDGTFGRAGQVERQIGQTNNEAFAIARNSSTGAFVVGVNIQTSFYLTRYTSAGILDRSFGGFTTSTGPGVVLAVVGSALDPRLPSGFAYIYDTTTQAVPGTWGTNITFNTNIVLNGWSHTAGSADITCNRTGTYLVSYTLNPVRTSAGTSQLFGRLTNNGTAVDGSGATDTVSVTGANNATSTTRLVMMSFESGDILRMQSSQNGNSLNLVAVVESAYTIPSVSLNIIPIL